MSGHCVHRPVLLLREGGIPRDGGRGSVSELGVVGERRYHERERTEVEREPIVQAITT